MPELVTTNALVLNRREWSESSQIVTLLTPDLGRIGAIARGARRAKGGTGPALEPVTESQVVLSTTSGSLAQIRSADVREFFTPVKSSLIRITLAQALCELGSRVLAENEENPSAYAHLLHALHGMNAGDDRTAVNWLWWGTLRLIMDIGYGIQVDECAVCGARPDRFRWFSPPEGGPICPNCTGDHLRPWLPDTRRYLAFLLGADDEALPTQRIPKRVNNDIRELLEDYLRYHVPNFDHIKSLDILAPLPGPAPRKTNGTEEQ